MKPSIRTTWDGRPIASDPPFGATVVVYKLELNAHTDFLLLHRSHQGPDFEGDWAWTPPSGARYPGEDIVECARRELLEETRLTLNLVRISRQEDHWALFVAKSSTQSNIRLSAEHDRFIWAPFETALELCRPERVSTGLIEAAKAMA